MTYRGHAKRGADAILAAVALVIASPALIALTALVRATLGAPAIFCQPRAGRDGAPFTIYKFRTMTSDRDTAGNLLPDAHRMTPFGNWLRSTSLDELPELWNVLRGDMSLVGPRPLLLEYLPLYSAHQSRRHEVRPGLTGLAQVESRNATDWDERLSQDVWYVDNVSPALDATIVLRTVGAVLRRKGISAAGHATMPAFTGAADQPATNSSSSHLSSHAA